MSCGLAIFVKTPGLSPVKTRLWPHLGRRDAETLHLLSAEAVASVAERAAREADIAPHWAIAESAAIGSDAWADLPHLAQGEGGLGERMARIYDTLTVRFGSALLVGADAPQLQPGDLADAARWLASGERRLTLGRALDGGFWLFGGNVPIRRECWTRVEYSTGRTADDFVASLADAGRWAAQRVLADLDVAQDLIPVCDALAGLHDPSPAQQRLADWLRAWTERACPAPLAAAQPPTLIPPDGGPSHA